MCAKIKFIKMIDLKIEKKNMFRCVKDYLKITDGSEEYKICGREVKIYHDHFCSNVIDISYLAMTGNFMFTNYRGFRLYYEGKKIRKINFISY